MFSRNSEAGRHKTQKQHPAWLSCVMVNKQMGTIGESLKQHRCSPSLSVFLPSMSVVTAPNQDPPQRYSSASYPQRKALFFEFMTAHTPLQGENWAHLSLSVPPIRKTDASQNSCGALGDDKAVHGRGSREQLGAA